MIRTGEQITDPVLLAQMNDPKTPFDKTLDSNVTAHLNAMRAAVAGGQITPEIVGQFCNDRRSCVDRYNWHYWVVAVQAFPSALNWTTIIFILISNIHFIFRWVRAGFDSEEMQ
jgi:hypothetical protein